MFKDRTITMRETEYTRLAEIVGSLMVKQFDGDQEAYRATTYEIFATFVEKATATGNVQEEA